MALAGHQTGPGPNFGDIIYVLIIVNISTKEK